MTRRNVRRRRITREKKSHPPESAVREQMKAGQDIIISGNFGPHQVANVDETAITFAIGPQYVYAPSDSDRGTQIMCGNSKSRFTGIPTVAANGEFLPTMYILKVR